MQLSESRCHRRCRRCPRSQLINSSSPLIGIHFISYATEWGLGRVVNQMRLFFQSKQTTVPHGRSHVATFNLTMPQNTHKRSTTRVERLADCWTSLTVTIATIDRSSAVSSAMLTVGERWKLLSLWCDARCTIGFVCSVDRISLISFHFSSPFFQLIFKNRLRFLSLSSRFCWVISVHGRKTSSSSEVAQSMRTDQFCSTVVRETHFRLEYDRYYFILVSFDSFLTGACMVWRVHWRSRRRSYNVRN